jgi:hypothetical protein
MVMRNRLLTLIAACALWLAPGRGHAQGAGASQGSAPRPAGTAEIDACRRPAGLDDREAENRAADHYDRGLRLYEQGDYEAAIEEFVSAYCHKPYHRVLKDVAQSFERMVNYEKAVAYLERYLRETPADEADERRVQTARMEVLRRLPARLRVATVPPGATVSLRDQHGVLQAHSDRADAAPIAIPEGRYAMRVEQPGYATIEQAVEVEIGQPYSYYFQLEPLKGALRLIAVPASARIFIDKRWVGVGSHVTELPLGTYLVEAEADGFLRTSEVVEIKATEPRNLTIELEAEPRSGRWELVAAATAGGGAWGSAVSASIFGENTLVGSGLAGLGLGLAFGGAYLAVPRDIEVGDSSYIIGSTLIGTVEGALTASFLAQRLSFCGEEPAREDDDDNTLPVDFARCQARVVSGAAMFGSLAGGVLGALTASRVDLDAGDAAVINSGALWGTVTGALLWAVFERDTRIGDVLGFTGLNLGIVAGVILAQRTSYSRSHVGLIDLGGLGGLLMGGLLGGTLSANDEDNDRVPHFALIGMASGLVFTSYLTRNQDEPARALPRVGLRLGQAADARGSAVTTFAVGGAF